MLVLVTYDIALDTPTGKRRLRRVAKLCEDYGQRVQFSVFECLVEPAQWVTFRKMLEDLIDPKRDSLRYYFLGKNWQRRIEHVGAKPSWDPEGPLVV